MVTVMMVMMVMVPVCFSLTVTLDQLSVNLSSSLNSSQSQVVQPNLVVQSAQVLAADTRGVQFTSLTGKAWPRPPCPAQPRLPQPRPRPDSVCHSSFMVYCLHEHVTCSDSGLPSVYSCVHTCHT